MLGASSFAGGMFAADSAQQKAARKVVDKEWLFNEYMKLSGGFQNSLLVRRIIDESGRTVDWLNENGAIMKLASAGTGGAYEHIGMPATLHGYQEGGAKALKALLESFKKAGGTAYFSTPATELVSKDGGRRQDKGQGRQGPRNRNQGGRHRDGRLRRQRRNDEGIHRRALHLRRSEAEHG